MNSNAFSVADMTTAAASGHRDGYQAGYADAVKAMDHIGDANKMVPDKSLSPLSRIADSFGVTGTWDQIADAVIARSTPAAPVDGAVLTNPYTGQPRDYRDVESDPQGTLIVNPSEPLFADNSTKKAWWAGYRAGKGLPPDTPRSVAASTPAAPGIDLEQFRPFVELERGFIANRIDRCDAIGTGERLTVLQAELANADRLLRLIDDSRLIDASPKGGIDACAWAGDGEGNWHTACGEIFTLMEGTPTDNKMRHCPYCGKNLRATSADVCVAVISASYEDTRSEAHDAARYRWLRNHYEPSFHDSECDSLIGLHGEDLDDAIDDEMQATSAEVGE